MLQSPVQEKGFAVEMGPRTRVFCGTVALCDTGNRLACLPLCIPHLRFLLGGKGFLLYRPQCNIPRRRRRWIGNLRGR